MVRASILVAIVVLVACEEPRGGGGGPITRTDGSIGQPDSGRPDSGRPDSGIRAPNAGPVDILFVVDNSADMDATQASLRAAFPAFLDALAPDADIEVAVVSTDTNSMGSEKAGLLVYTHNSNSPNQLVSIDNTACTSVAIEHGCFRGADPARRILRSSSLSRAEMVAGFQENVSVGTCGSGEEKGLAAAQLALERRATGMCNEGFLRSNARLVVIYVSSEEDTDTVLVPQYVNDLFRFKTADAIRVAVIVGAVDGQAASCRTPELAGCGQSVCNNPPPQNGSHTTCNSSDMCPSGEFCDWTINACENQEREWLMFCNWCAYYQVADCCEALSGSRYVDFAREVGARVIAAIPAIADTDCNPAAGTAGACLVESICQANLTATMVRIADTLVSR